MKLKVNKYQQGGGLVTFTPIVNQGPQQSAATKVEETKSPSLMDDEVYKELIKTGGLVGDVNKFVDELQSIESDPMAFLNPGKSGKALNLMKKLNWIKQNKDMFEQSVQKATTNGGLSEVAIGTSGELYARGKNGKISAISMGDYQKNSDKYKLLTVSEMLNARQYEDQLAFDSHTFTVVENSIGINKIHDHIKNVVDTLGLEDVSSESYRDKAQLIKEISASNGVKAPNAAQLKGLKELVAIGDAPNGLYKITQSSKSERGYLKEAMSYIWSTLPKNAQDKLKATAILNGGSAEDVESIIGNILTFGSNETVDTKIEAAPTDLQGSGSGSSAKLGNLTPFEIFHEGKLGATPILWNDPALSPGKTLAFQATSTGRIPKDLEGNPMGMATIGQILKSPNGNLFSGNKVYFGENEVGLTDLDNIIYDGADAARVYLPTKNGAPNYDRLVEFNEIKKEADTHIGEWSPDRIMDFYRQRGFDVAMDKDYKILDTGEVKPFLLAHGYTTDQTQVSRNNEKLKALNSSEKGMVYDGIVKFYKDNKISPPTDWTDWGTGVYKGTIAIPYSENASIYAGAMAKNITSPKTGIVEARIAQEQANAEGVSNNNTGFLTD